MSTLNENIAAVNLEFDVTLPEFNASNRNPEQLSLTPKKKLLNSRPKILFILPNLNWIDDDVNALWDLFPWNLCLLAAMVEDVCDVVILDAYQENYTEDELEIEIRKANPDVVGITVLMDQYGEVGHRTAEITKKVSNDILTLMGGVYATTNSESAAKDLNIDYVMVGESEYAFKDLIHYLMGNDDIQITNGIAYIDDGVVVNKGHSDLIKDLDELPRPAYHLIDFLSYANNSSERKTVDVPPAFPYARIVTSRGCPFKCSFCQVPSIQGRYYRNRSVSHILDEISWLKEKYGIKAIVFDDDNLYTNMNKAKELFQGIIDAGLSMPWVSIATAVFRLDEELLDLMHASGCRYIDIAIESGSERVTKEIVLKPIDHKRAEELVKYARSIGIFVAANFIIGFPGETWEEILETIKYAEVIEVDYAKIFIAIPLKNTVMYEMAKKQGALKEEKSENIWSSGGMLNTDEFDSQDLTILRAYEWERINFTDPIKRKKIADRMGITLDELSVIRKRTISNARKKIVENSYPAASVN